MDGARLHSLSTQCLYAMERVVDAFEAHGQVCRFKRIADGTHMNASLHYPGFAVDVGLRGIGSADRDGIVADIREALGSGELLSDFDVVYGSPGHLHHIHIEWQPKRALNR